MKLLGVSGPAAMPGAPTQPQAPLSTLADRQSQGASAATYSSPAMTIDGMTGSLIIEYRNGTSGEEVSQTPSRAALEYEQTQRLVAEKSGIVKNGGGR